MSTAFPAPAELTLYWYISGVHSVIADDGSEIAIICTAAAWGKIWNGTFTSDLPQG